MEDQDLINTISYLGAYHLWLSFSTSATSTKPHGVQIILHCHVRLLWHNFSSLTLAHFFPSPHKSPHATCRMSTYSLKAANLTKSQLLVINIICKRDSRSRFCSYTSILLSGYSLWVEFVERAVHSYSDAELLKATVQSYLVHHGRQTGSTQLGRTFGHHTANLLHQNTVITRAADQTQVLQDGAHLPQRQTIADRNSTLIITNHRTNTRQTRFKENITAAFYPKDGI